jgi:hypothetical protein
MLLLAPSIAGFEGNERGDYSEKAGGGSDEAKLDYENGREWALHNVAGTRERTQAGVEPAAARVLGSRKREAPGVS